MNRIIDITSNDQIALLMNFIKEKLNDKLKCMFADHFTLSLIDSKDKFPIKGEIAMKWLGYTRKDSFKRFFEKHLIEKENYSVLLRSVENVQGATRTSEIYSFSVDSFKILGMKAGTKKGDLIRSYYIELEKLIFEYGIYQHQKFVEESNKKLNESEITTKIL